MFSIDLTINGFILLAIFAGSGFLGYSLRSRQIKKKQFKIVELRKEMVDNHAYILELQKEYVALQTKLNVPNPTISNNSRIFEIHQEEVLDSAI
jgi:cell division protein FtsB